MGIACADSMPAGPRADRRAPVDNDFRGLSVVDESVTSRSRSIDLIVFALLRGFGHTNCRRYSVLNLCMVFFNRPLEDSPA